MSAFQYGLPGPAVPSPVRRALRRSRARCLVLRALVEGGPATATELGRRTGLAPTAVYGALRGLGARYRPSDALVALGLASVGANGKYAPSPAARSIISENLHQVSFG